MVGHSGWGGGQSSLTLCSPKPHGILPKGVASQISVVRVNTSPWCHLPVRGTQDRALFEITPPNLDVTSRTNPARQPTKQAPQPINIWVICKFPSRKEKKLVRSSNMCIDIIIIKNKVTIRHHLMSVQEITAPGSTLILFVMTVYGIVYTGNG